MSFPSGLRHFSPEEFKHAENMDSNFLHWLDEVRDVAGVPFHLTSDFRTPEENAAASGSSPTSLHLLGRAVDFEPVPWTAMSLFAVVGAVMRTAAPDAVELELVHGPDDAHVHLGLFVGGVHTSRLELSLT